MPTYVTKNNQQLGPFDDAQVLEAIRGGVYSPEDLGWRDGLANWQTLRSLYPTEPLPPPLPGMQRFATTPKNIGDDAGMRLLLPVGRSVWAIVAGYLGLFAFVIAPAPLALIVSIIAIWDIRRSKNAPHPKHGMGRAIFGLITGGLGTAVLIMIVVSRFLPAH